MAAIADGLRAPAALRQEALAATRRWLAAAAPTVIRTPDRLGFDLAVVMPVLPRKPDPRFDKKWRISRVRQPSVDTGDTLRSPARALVRRRPSGEVHRLQVPSLLLEGDAASAAMVKALVERRKPGDGWHRTASADQVAGWMSASPSDLLGEEFDPLPPHLAGFIARMVQAAASRSDCLHIGFPCRVKLMARDEGEAGSAVYVRLTALHEWTSYKIAGIRAADAARFDDVMLSRGEAVQLPRADILPDNLVAFLEMILRRAFVAARQDAVQGAFNDFRSGLDRGILASVGDSSQPGRCYNWLLAGGDKKLSAVRRQALASYPALVGEVAIRPHADRQAGDPSARPPSPLAAVEAAIDAEDVLEPAMALGFSLPVAAVRALRGVSDADITPAVNFTRSIAMIAQLTARGPLPPGHWPRPSREVPLGPQWSGLFMVARCHVALHEPGISNSLCMPPADERLRAEAPVWRTRAGLDRLFADGVCPEFMIFDMAEAFVSQVLVPLAVDAVLTTPDKSLDWSRLTGLIRRRTLTEPSAVAAALGRSRSLLGLIDLTDHWHKHQRAMDAAITCATDDRAWPALFARRAVGDLIAVPLVSAAELARDGAQQEHCVATYAARCLYERTHIVSLQTPGGGRVATLELAVEHDVAAPGVTIVQNQGRNNGDPGPVAEAAAAALLGDIASGSAIVDWAGVEAARARREADRPASTSDIAMMIGYDPLDAVGRDTALAQWAFALPRTERGLAHAQWAEQTGLSSLILRHLDQTGHEVAHAACTSPGG